MASGIDVDPSHTRNVKVKLQRKAEASWKLMLTNNTVAVISEALRSS